MKLPHYNINAPVLVLVMSCVPVPKILRHLGKFFTHLLVKVEELGITGNFLESTKNWLGNIKNRFVINGTCHGWIEVLTGIPQY